MQFEFQPYIPILIGTASAFGVSNACVFRCVAKKRRNAKSESERHAPTLLEVTSKLEQFRARGRAGKGGQGCRIERYIARDRACNWSEFDITRDVNPLARTTLRFVADRYSGH